jgi:hypothetical protein
MMERLIFRQPNSWKAACRCAVSGGVPSRSFLVALVVGTVLNIINQGDAVLGAGPINWVKLVLTYLVPYAVCTYGSVSSQLAIDRQRALNEVRPTPPAAITKSADAAGTR